LIRPTIIIYAFVIAPIIPSKRVFIIPDVGVTIHNLSIPGRIVDEIVMVDNVVLGR
jgi:hypothetical protein